MTGAGAASVNLTGVVDVRRRRWHHPAASRPRTWRAARGTAGAAARIAPPPSPPEPMPDSRRILDHPILGPLPPAAEVPFSFDGRPLVARAGEPIAAALLAAGVQVFRTMPGSGEPRGGWCMVGRCADCFVVVDGQPNVRACRAPVGAGMRVETQHGLDAGRPSAAETVGSDPDRTP